MQFCEKKSPIDMVCVKNLFNFLPILSIFLVIQELVQAGNVNLRNKEKQILDKIFKTYDNMIRPPGENGTGPTVVVVNLFVRSIATIDDVKMEYKIQLTFRENWLDERLSYNHYNNTDDLKYLTLSDSARIWKPGYDIQSLNLFYSNEKTGLIHNNLRPNLYIRIFPDGEVLYSIRISLTLACPMNLRQFPIDKQICSIRMASYGWTTLDLIFKWKNENPVQIPTDLQLFRFVLKEFYTEQCDSFTNTGNYSCIRADFLFRREFRYYLINVYGPCCMLIIVSWISFWLDPNSVPARVTIGVTALLAMSNQISKINQSLPPVSYMKALDVWTAVSLSFVFGALLEFAMVNYASRCDRQKSNIIKEMEEHRRKAHPKDKGAILKKKLIILKSSERGRNFPEGIIYDDFRNQNHLENHNQQSHTNNVSLCASPISETKDSSRRRSSNQSMQNFSHHHQQNFQNQNHQNFSPPTLKGLQLPLEIEQPKKRWTLLNRLMPNIFMSLYPSKAKRIDILARIIFPLVFALFNISYWTAYLTNF